MAYEGESHFALDISKFAEKTGLSLDVIVRKVVLDLFTEVTLGTPVDTGRARGNWLPSVGAPADGAEWHKVSPSGQETIAAITAFATKLKAGQVAFLTNNLPYIRRLEFGHEETGKPWSQQAPDGMVRIAVARAAEFLRTHSK